MSTRERVRRTRLAVVAASLAAATGIACAELGTGIDDISYLEFDGIPYPAFIAGDTMRDSLGAVAPLRASAFDAAGKRIADPAFTYFALDTGVVIGADGILRATGRRDGTVRLVASLGGLQTDDRLVRVTRRPDSLLAATATDLSLAYTVPDGSTNVAPEMRVRLVSADSMDFGPNVGGWIVQWRTVRGTDTLSAGDTSWVVLQTASGRRSARDTTAADGTSARRLRVFAARIPEPVDSFIVLAEVRRHGQAVPGSPVRFVVNVAPPAAP